MKIITKKRLAGIGLLFAISMGLSVSIAQNSAGSSSASGPVKLVYKYPGGQPVKYLTVSKLVQTMDIMGQSMQVNVNSVFGCTIKAVGMVDGNMKLEVIVDTIGQNTQSPMGSTGGAMKDVQGKVFNIVISPLGKDIDISEAEKIVYNIEGSGESNLSETFINYFPELPENQVKAGDTWSSTDSVTTTTTSMMMKNIATSVNKFEGFETVDGIQCAKISSVITGNRVMNIHSNETNFFLKGPFTGTAEFLFSVRDGYFIKQVVNSRMTGTMDMTLPEAMTFPVVMEINSINEVKK